MCDDGGIGWFEIVRLLATVGAFLFAGVALLISAGERRRLRRRLRVDRLEELAIAIAHARTSIRLQSSNETERDLAGVRARVSALPRTSHPKAWALAEREFDAQATEWSPAVQGPLLALVSDAEDETRDALADAVGELD